MPRSLSLFIHTAGPHTALIKSSGRKHVQVVIGGRMFAIPVWQRVDRLSLELRTITVHTRNGLTKNGVSVDITSACQVKIQGWSSGDDATSSPMKKNHMALSGTSLQMDSPAIQLAAQHFLEKSDSQMEDTIQKTISGHQRAIIGSLTVEELYRDRAAFCRQVLDLISSDMRNMGLTVVSYTVAEISDANGYIDALGVTKTEEVKRTAVEGAAKHRAEAKSYSAKEDAKAHLEVNMQIQRKIESDKQRSIIEAEAQQQVQRQLAIQNKAHAISSAEQDAVLLVARQKAKAAETQAELNVIKQQVEKERLEKEKQINVEADAFLYKAKVHAQSVRATAAADAARVQLLGEAEAEAIRRKGLAEVDILRERNRAWAESMNSGAILEKITQVLPEVAKAIAAPLARTEKMVFVSNGGSGGGPAAFAKDFNRVVAEVPEVVGALTGIDLRKAIETLSSKDTRGSIMQGAAEGGVTAVVQESMSKMRK